jgi:hypothetical protein
MAPEPIPVMFFINPSHQFVLYVCPPIVARQWLGRNVTTAMNTHTTIEEFLNMLFSIWPMLYKKKETVISSQNFLFSTHCSSRG